MTAKYKVCVVGLGKRGEHHVTHFHRHKDFEVTAICDNKEKRVAEIAANLNNPITGTNAREVAMKAKPDVFCFCTRPTMRKELIQLAIDCGAKLIAFEKPLALTSAEGLAIKNLIDEAGIKAVVSYQHRYGKHYQKVAEIIQSGAIGKVHTIYATALGWPAHLMTHMLHYSRWFANNPEADWVIANGAGRSKLESADKHYSPDYISGFVQFKNGIRGIYEVGAGAPDVPEVEKWWHKNCIGAKGTEGFAEVYTGNGYKAVTKDGILTGDGCMDYEKDMPGYIQDIADDLNGIKPHPCNVENAFQNFSIWQAMNRSIIERGQSSLPLLNGIDEITELKKVIPNKKLCVTIDASKKEY